MRVVVVTDSDHGFVQQMVEEAGLAVLGEAHDHHCSRPQLLDLSVTNLEDGEEGFAV